MIGSASAPSTGPSPTALKRRAVLGGIAAAPALYFIGASILKYSIGIGFFYVPIEAMTSTPAGKWLFDATTPVLFIGGLALGWALNISPLLRFRALRRDDAVIGKVRVALRPLNIAVAAASGAGMLALFMYLMAEASHHAR